MLWTAFVLLMLVWLFCVVVAGITGIAIHLLLVVAAVVLFTRLLAKR
jgi:hypothetical protein